MPTDQRTLARYRIRGTPESYCYIFEKFEFNTSQGEYWRPIDHSKDRSFLEDRKALYEGAITEREFCKRNMARKATRKR